MKHSLITVFIPLTAIAIVSALDACSEDDPAARSSGGSTSSGGNSGSGGTSGSSGSSGGTSGSSGSSGSSGDSGGDGSSPDFVGPDGGVSTKMNFFVTSKGNGKGGDFRANPSDADGLAGADAFCKSLANAVSPILGARNWKAYLSTNLVTARSRIGNGPFINAKGVTIANDAAHLHDEGGQNNLLSATTNLDELGNPVPFGGASGANKHDILTGTLANGSAAPATCANWTSSANSGVSGQVGHSNRLGGGANPMSWNSAHATQGCAATGGGSVESGGGRGSFYCFAVP